MIPVVESFYSFQGEGKYAGSPSVFVRFGGCNLGCPGFGVAITSAKDNQTLIGCDSIRAVNSEHFGAQWQKVDDLISLIEGYIKGLSFKPDIVYTGGEPLLHYQNPLLVGALLHFSKRGHRITFETNATIEIDFEKYPVYKEVIFAMSVKLANSGEEMSKRINHKAIGAIAVNAKDTFFKFVLSRFDMQTKEIEEITELYPKIPIYCMPMGSSAGELAKNDKAVAAVCIQHGYYYVDRMHIRLWDNEEGR